MRNDTFVRHMKVVDLSTTHESDGGFYDTARHSAMPHFVMTPRVMTLHVTSNFALRLVTPRVIECNFALRQVSRPVFR
jgi:hypothetical protein